MFTVGNIGHFFVVASFVFSLVFFISFLISEKSKNKIEWFKFASLSFYIHALFVVGVISAIYYLIINNKFEYYYAFQHSSKSLPIYFKISSFWEGQEGSFLLWIFWNVVIGFVFINKPISKWTTSIMVVLGVIQLFLTSMVLGVVLFDIKIGSSPFILLKDAISAPIFQLNPSFVPEDGTGLNPLLQNYWMVIHPPTLFLGFAVCVIPFSYAISSLRLGDYTGWIKPAKKSLIISTIILGIGIMMGAYWAYETLNFGGYWNWDPVENAVYVPWLFLVASFHSIVLTQKNKDNYKLSLILSILSFILILYSTFLTRSGILGDSSVHSFTDLGLSGQLLLFLLSFILISIYLLFKRWNEIPSSKKEKRKYSAEFWLFIGIFTLLLMSFQVIFPTSIPVYNAIIEFFGGFSNIAPPVEKELFYSNAQIWFASIIAVISGIAQVLWWRGKRGKQIISLFSRPLILSMITSSSIILLYPVNNISYMVLLFCSCFSIFSNGSVLLYFFKSKNFVSSASISHVGLATMLIGILFSSGYSSIVSKNYTGLVWNNDFPDEVNQNNMLLFINENRNIGNYKVSYLGERKKIVGSSEMINNNHIEYVPILDKFILKKNLFLGKKNYNENDTIELENKNISFFEIEFSDENNNVFTLYPKVQMDPNSDMIVFSPDVENNITEDLYVHVRTFPDPEQEIIWRDKDSLLVKMNETFFLNDYVSVVEKVIRKNDVNTNNRFEVEISIKVLANNQEYIARPVYIIEDNKVGLIPDIIDDLGIKIYLSEIIPETQNFKIIFQTTQKNWVIIEAVQKPFINLLWLGFFILLLGLILALFKTKKRFINAI
jgi:cytochrome c-type biogenesis protein CcmF|tara:strand:- start:567 stop:3059 length:2493 start_codon:yes stop_codon:yes gene_type:complete